MAALISLYDWLVKQKGLRSPLGELARTVTRDSGFPRDCATLDGFLAYVRASPQASAEAIAIARATYRAYERSAKPASRA
jgi:hypothetical protein